MATYNYKAGLHNVGSYQVSGIPFVSGGITQAPSKTATGDPHEITFPQVTRWIVINNGGGDDEDLEFGFSSNGVKHNTNKYILGGGQQSVRMEVKVTKLFYTGSCTGFTIMAGLTGLETSVIDNQAISPLGSNWSGSTAAVVG